jgi:hypothetical protein
VIIINKMIDKDFELKIENNMPCDIKASFLTSVNTDIPVQRSMSVTFEFTKKELEENLNQCIDNEQIEKYNRIETLIREGWELTSIFKQIDKENDPNRGMVTIELTRF